jgi:RimJ/RimL family protein N-acetyltransferase
MQPVSTSGQFIRLEPLSLEHLPDLEKGFDPSLFDFYPKPYSNARVFVQENLEMHKLGNYLPFAIRLAATGEAIGCTEFSDIDEPNRKLEIGGSWLRSDFHGSAANVECKYLLLRHVFEELRFVRVQFRANALNLRSRVALEKMGAKFEGILRNVMILSDGTLRDDAYFSVIDEEWPIVKRGLEQRTQIKLGASQQRKS